MLIPISGGVAIVNGMLIPISGGVAIVNSVKVIMPLEKPQ